MTTLDLSTRRKFAAHETFAPRFGWLRKAHDAVAASPAVPAPTSAVDSDVAPEVDPEVDVDVDVRSTDAPVVEGARAGEASDVFLSADAPVALGVGKNMVNAIRFWAQAFGVTTEERRGDNSRAFVASTTADGRWLFGPDGVDPWLEDPASLWLLHWWLLRPASIAPTWWVAFNLLPGSRFTEDALISLIESQISLAGWDPVMRSSIAKDVDCLTKMYAPRKRASGSPGSVEDLLDCPFRELGLLEAVPDTPKTWRFADVTRLAVPPAIVLYTSLDFMDLSGADSQITVARLARDPGSPGRVLKMSQSDLTAALEQAAADFDVSVSSSLGDRSLIAHDVPGKLAVRVRDRYYEQASMVCGQQR